MKLSGYELLLPVNRFKLEGFLAPIIVKRKY